MWIGTLKFVSDSLIQQLKQKSANQVSLNENLKLIHPLKLPSNEKCNFPDAVLYLDQGDLTFMKLVLLPWMYTTEDRMVALLNAKR